MSFRVELTAGAHADLARLMAWLEERSSIAAADRFSARFYEALDRLESRPLSCGLAYENRYFPEEVRHLLFRVGKSKPYRALFIAQDGRGENPLHPGPEREARQAQGHRRLKWERSERRQWPDVLSFRHNPPG